MLEAYFDDLLDNVAVLVADITGVHLHVVVALNRGQLYFYITAGQFNFPGLRLNFDLQREHITASGGSND